jgi:hypothetical protein
MKINQKEHSKEAPRQQIFANMKNQSQDDIDKRSAVAQVPVDEVDAVGIKVSPTFGMDNIQSVNLKSFRKVVGYDTFNSILKKDRSELKDPSDYYNVTVSMMIQRKQKPLAVPAKAKDAKSLAEALDKGFPYDDADFNVLERAKPLQALSVKTTVGQLDGQNISMEALKNLIVDKVNPLTAEVGLVQLDEMKSDADNLSTLFDHNVTRGALKNLITDQPSPITMKLA